MVTECRWFGKDILISAAPVLPVRFDGYNFQRVKQEIGSFIESHPNLSSVATLSVALASVVDFREVEDLNSVIQVSELVVQSDSIDVGEMLAVLNDPRVVYDQFRYLDDSTPHRASHSVVRVAADSLYLPLSTLWGKALDLGLAELVIHGDEDCVRELWDENSDSFIPLFIIGRVEWFAWKGSLIALEASSEHSVTDVKRCVSVVHGQ